jgi:hypothetical protein
MNLRVAVTVPKIPPPAGNGCPALGHTPAALSAVIGLDQVGGPERPDAEPPDAAPVTIRRQALEIIEEVLSGTCPGQAEARARLRICVADKPGAPELAILEHLKDR